MPWSSVCVSTSDLFGVGDLAELREHRVATRVGLALLGDDAVRTGVTFELDARWHTRERRIARRLARSVEAAVMGIVEEDRLRLRQPERRIPVHQIDGDDAAEGEAEVARVVELRLDSRRITLEKRERTANAVQCRRDARFDVVRSGAGSRDVSLPTRVDDDRSLADGVPDQLVHRVVAGVLVVAVHDDRAAARIVGWGSTGSKTYHASAPLPPWLTRQSPFE